MTQQPTYSKARIANQDGSKVFEFLINPEELTETHGTDFAVLPVLATAQPLVRYRYSSSGLSIPTVKFWSDRNDTNLKPALDQLTAWTKPEAETREPPILKFSWGEVNYPRIYIRNFSYVVTLRQPGTAYPLKATGSLELLIAPETPTAETKPEVKLSPREQQTNLERVRQRLRDTPALAQQLGVTPQAELRITEAGNLEARVSNRWVALGSIQRVLGDRLRPGLRTP